MPSISHEDKQATQKQQNWVENGNVTLTATAAAKIPRKNSPRLQNGGRSGKLQLAAWLISISSFMWGYGAAVLNVCIVPNAVGSLLVDINLSMAEQETATALVVVGAVVSALTTGGIGERVGQKKTILVNNVFYIVGGAICAMATSKRAIYLGRFCIGIASGIVTNTVPILLNEISPPHATGQITSFHQLLLTIGMLFSGILGYFIIEDVPAGWRVLNGFMIVPPLIQCLAMAFIPESPWWLMKNKGREESKKVLLYLRHASHQDAVEKELHEIAVAMEHRRHEREVTWSDLRAHKKVITMGTILVFFQAMTGINTVMLYSAKIFHFADVGNPFFATAIVGIVNVGTTVVAVRMVDSCGRKPLLLVGTFIMVIALLSLSLSLLYLNGHIHVQGTIAVVSVLFFVSGFAVGLGAVVWVMLGDITPVHIRSRAFSVYMGISYLCNIIIAVYTLSAINFLGRGPNPEKDGIAKLYFILSGVALFSLVYIFICVKEPGLSSAAHVEEQNGLLLREEEDEELDVQPEKTEL